MVACWMPLVTCSGPGFIVTLFIHMLTLLQATERSTWPLNIFVTDEHQYYYSV